MSTTTQRPTPETDDEQIRFNNVESFDDRFTVPASFARKLERERDEAREQLEAMRDAIREAYDALFRMVSSCRRYLEERPCSIHDEYDENYISPISQSESALGKLKPLLKP